MPAIPPPRPRATGDRALLLFALANAGGVIGFLPLLTLLLPIKIDEVAPDMRLGLVTATTLAGAVAASVSNILFGWLSDAALARGIGRRRFILGGLVATAASYGLIAQAASPGAIVAAVALFQVALNAMLCPFQATMADEVPDERKGVAGGLLALANPMASAVSALVVGVALLDEAARFAIVAGAMVLCTLPLLIAVPGPALAASSAGPRVEARADLAAAWLSRLLVQIAGAVLFYYLLFYFQSVAADRPVRGVAADVGRLMTIAYILPLPVALLVGRLSDRSGRRRPFLVASGLLAAAGLAGMAAAGDWRGAAIAFTAYAVGSSTFLALHATFAMQLLPSAAKRGRDLGLLNLTNTLPALIGPALAWALADPRDFSALMMVLAVLTALGGVAMLGVRARQ